MRSSLEVATFFGHTKKLSEQGESELGTLLNVAKLAAVGNERLSVFAIAAERFYLTNDKRLAWVDRKKPTRQARDVLMLLRNCEEKGLDPEDYQGHFGAFLIAPTETPVDTSESALIRFDLALTLAAMGYISDVRLGRSNPGNRTFSIGVDDNELDLAAFTKELSRARNAAAMAESVEPSYNGYTRTLAALRQYRDYVRHDKGGLLPSVQKPVSVGMKYEGLSRLRALLQLVGDLPKVGEPTPDFYDEELRRAVSRFQERHGLEPNGLLDSATIRELNVPLNQRVLELTLTLERWRWLPEDFSRPPIVVNIPEFRLHVIDAQRHIVDSMNIVVGRAYHHQTPVFESEIRSILFRPPWNVPLEIQRKELVPQIEKNPAYLTENSFDVVDANGKVVEGFPNPSETIDKLKSGRLFLRQRPGDDNSLGLVKFEFPNPYDIYMHGTPAQDLFSQTRRDFSHGCVRVEDPVALAVWLLRDTPGWNRERIETAMHADRSERVVLQGATPVWIVYGTAVVLEDGRVRFFKDLYGEDATLQRELATKRAIDSARTTSLEE